MSWRVDVKVQENGTAIVERQMGDVPAGATFILNGHTDANTDMVGVSMQRPPAHQQQPQPQPAADPSTDGPAEQPAPSPQP